MSNTRDHLLAPTDRPPVYGASVLPRKSKPQPVKHTHCGSSVLPGPPFVRNIIANELTERFSYYGLRAVLTLYLTEELGFESNQAISTFMYFSAGAYIMSIVGGLVADSYLGKFLTVLLFASTYFVGTVILAFTTMGPYRWGAITGLVLIAIGTGGIKPNVAAFGAQQFELEPDDDDEEEDGDEEAEWKNEGDAHGDPMQPLSTPKEGDTPASLVSDEAAARGATEGFKLSARQRRVESYFSAFYFSINCGSVISFIVTPLARAHVGFGAAFGLSCIMLFASILLFWWPVKKYLKKKPSGSVLAQVMKVLWSAGSEQVRRHGWCWCCCRRASSSSSTDTEALWGDARRDAEAKSTPAESSSSKQQHQQQHHTPVVAGIDADYEAPPELIARAGWLNSARGKYPNALVDSTAAVVALCPILLLMMGFWACFDQQGSSWTLQAKKMNLGILQPDQLGAFNPVLVLLFIPVFDRFLLPFWRSHSCGICVPTSLRRMGIGMLLAGGSFLLAAWTQQQIDTQGEGNVTVWLQLPQYAVITVGEILLSVTGMHFAYSEAPPTMRSTLLALWYVSTGFGDIIGGVLYDVFTKLSQAEMFVLFAGLMGVSFVIFSVLAWRYVPTPKSLFDLASPPMDDAAVPSLGKPQRGGDGHGAGERLMDADQLAFGHDRDAWEGSEDGMSLPRWGDAVVSSKDGPGVGEESWLTADEVAAEVEAAVDGRGQGSDDDETHSFYSAQQ